MKNIIDVYKKYKIFPDLQMHMLRVAAVAKMICDSSDLDINKQDVILTCLLHDIGNIIKVRMNILPESFEPEGVEYWQKVKDEFISKYGTDEHHASLIIVEEMGLDKLVPFIDCFGFVNSFKNLETDDFVKKICFYSDQRVAFVGVLPLLVRLEDNRRRHVGRVFDLVELGEERVVDALIKIEKQIFSHCKITPEDITDEAVAPIIEELRGFVIE